MRPKYNYFFEIIKNDCVFNESCIFIPKTRNFLSRKKCPPFYPLLYKTYPINKVNLVSDSFKNGKAFFIANKHYIKSKLK